MVKYEFFHTERLTLKLMDEADASFLLELLNTPKWIEYIGDRKVKSIDGAKAYIRTKMLPQVESHGYGNYAVIRKTDGITIGSCGLYDREGLEGVDIGFAFLPQYEGKGYALEASKKIMEVGISTFGISTISAITTKANLSSQRLIEKLGLIYIKNISLPDDQEELLLYKWEA